jgi:hypothetical protein
MYVSTGFVSLFCFTRIYLKMWTQDFLGVDPGGCADKGLVLGRSLVGIAGSNPSGGMEVFCCECCVLSGSGPCVRLITPP